MQSNNPGHRFLQSFSTKRKISIEELLDEYAKYLLIQANTYRFPMDIDKVFEYFNLQMKKAPLSGRGAVTPDLQILLNSSDTIQRQNYTKAHELTEILIASIVDQDAECLTDADIQKLVEKDKKEVWCEIGASKILMPMEPFTSYIHDYGYSLKTAQSLAKSSNLSLTAVIRRMLASDLRKCAMVVWKYMLKPREISSQMSFWDMRQPRVEYSYQAPSLKAYIPHYKSVEEASIIGQTFNTNNGDIQSGYNYLMITKNHARYLVEAIRVRYENEDRVFSLIFFDDIEK